MSHITSEKLKNDIYRTSSVTFFEKCILFLLCNEIDICKVTPQITLQHFTQLV